MVSFGSHGPYVSALGRLGRQARALGIFDALWLNTAAALDEAHLEFAKACPRGYGYWRWKPYLIQRSMRRLRDGDSLLYLDCGCELREGHRTPLLARMQAGDPITATTLANFEGRYCKMDLMLRMQATQFALTPIQQAGMILFTVSPATRRFVDEWLALASEPRNVDDSPSVAPNLPFFVEHRHDQSIFSLLGKKMNLFSSRSLEGCADYCRNRTGIPKGNV